MTRLIIYINSDQITDIHVLYRFFINVVKNFKGVGRPFKGINNKDNTQDL